MTTSTAERAAIAEAAERPGYGPLIPAFITIFIVATTISFLAPLLLALTGDFGVTLADGGQLVMATALAWGAASPFTGLIGDRIGRRPVIVVSLVGMGTATIAGAFATEFWMLLTLRAAVGLFGSGGPPSIMAGIGDLYPARFRGRAVGWTMSGFSFAALIGVPAIGALGGLTTWRMAFVATGMALLLAAVFVRLVFPAGRTGGSGAGNPLRAYRHLFGVPNLITVLGANLLERVTFMAVTLYYASFLIETYGLTPVSVAPALAIVALGAILGNVSGGFLADRFSRPALAASALLGAGIFGLATFLWPVHLAVSIGLGFAFGLLNAAAKPPHFSLALGLSEEHRGALLGLIALSNQIGFAIGAGVGGAIVAWFGFGSLGLSVLVLSVVAAGILSRLLAAGRR